MARSQDLRKFGKHFQNNLVKKILADKCFADQIAEVLEVRFFTYEIYSIVIDKFYEYKRKYKMYPTIETLLTFCLTNIDSDNIRNEIKSYFKEQKFTEIDNPEYVMDEAIRFCRNQKMVAVIIESAKLLADEKEGCEDIIRSKIDIVSKLGIEKDDGYQYVADFEDRYNIVQGAIVPTCWQEINALLPGGGLGKGEEGIIIAPTGVGKSFGLCNLGAHAIMNELNVLHYTFELSKLKTALRYDSYISGYSLNELSQHKTEVLKKIKDYKGKLIIKQFPPRTKTIDFLRADIEKTFQLFEKPFDLIIMDYGDKIKPATSSSDKKTEQLGDIYEDLRAIAMEFNVALWTATQTNRGGVNAELVSMADISEAFSKCWPADFIMTFSRTVEEKQNNKGKVFIAKARDASDAGIYPAIMDLAYAKIEILPKQKESSVGSDVRADLKTKSLYEKFKEKMNKE